MTNDLRKYIQIVESKEQLDEAGGFLDKIISNLGGIPGLSDIAAGAEGRVEAKDISKILRRTWVKYAAKTDKDKKDPEAVKEFFKQVGLDDNDIASIKGLDGLRADLKIAFRSGATVVSELMGAINDTETKKTKKIKKSKEIKGRPTGADLDSNVTYFKQKFSGNTANLRKEALRIRRNPKVYKDRPLALLGWAYLEANGLEK